MIARAIGGVLFEKGHQFVVDDTFDHRPDFGVAELGLGLAFKLRFRQLDADDRAQAFADILALQVLVSRP